MVLYMIVYVMGMLKLCFAQCLSCLPAMMLMSAPFLVSLPVKLTRSGSVKSSAVLTVTWRPMTKPRDEWRYAWGRSLCDGTTILVRRPSH